MLRTVAAHSVVSAEEWKQPSMRGDGDRCVLRTCFYRGDSGTSHAKGLSLPLLAVWTDCGLLAGAENECHGSELVNGCLTGGSAVVVGVYARDIPSESGQPNIWALKAIAGSWRSGTITQFS